MYNIIERLKETSNGKEAMIQQGVINFACAQVMKAPEKGYTMKEWNDVLQEIASGETHMALMQCINHMDTFTPTAVPNHKPSKTATTSTVTEKKEYASNNEQQRNVIKKHVQGSTYKHSIAVYAGYHYGKYFHPTLIKQAYHAFEQGMKHVIYTSVE